jgi:hypothetical protein
MGEIRWRGYAFAGPVPDWYQTKRTRRQRRRDRLAYYVGKAQEGRSIDRDLGIRPPSYLTRWWEAWRDELKRGRSFR